MERRYLCVPDAVDDEGEQQYLIESNDAYVAHAKTHCQCCAAQIEAIAIYCTHGTLDTEPLDDFSVMRISAVDAALEAQLAPWPFFYKKGALFRNYCPQCGAPQLDIDLHCEPDGPFFHLKAIHTDATSRRVMTLTPLAGRIRLNGEETFEP